MRIRLPHEVSASIVAGATVFLTMSPLDMPTWAIFITWAGTFLLGGPTRANAVKLITASTAGAGFGVAAVLLDRAAGTVFGGSGFDSGNLAAAFVSSAAMNALGPLCAYLGLRLMFAPPAPAGTQAEPEATLSVAPEAPSVA